MQSTEPGPDVLVIFRPDEFQLDHQLQRGLRTECSHCFSAGTGGQLRVSGGTLSGNAAMTPTPAQQLPPFAEDTRCWVWYSAGALRQVQLAGFKT